MYIYLLRYIIVQELLTNPLQLKWGCHYEVVQQISSVLITQANDEKKINNCSLFLCSNSDNNNKKFLPLNKYSRFNIINKYKLF